MKKVPCYTDFNNRRETRNMTFENFSQKLEKAMSPFTNFVNTNKSVQAITSGFISANPIILGAALFAIIANFPIPAWTSFLSETGVAVHLSAIIQATSNLLALYVVFAIAYRYAKSEGEDALTSGILSVASFVIIMPQTVEGKEAEISALMTKYLGSEGLFVALIISLISAKIFVKLMKKGLVIKLPDSVPEMVARSLAPTFVSMIIFAVAVGIRIGFSFTAWGNAFNFVGTIVGRPIVALGSSIPAIICAYTFMNFMWFFGIHPSPIMGIYMPVIMSINLMNIEAMQAGTVLPYLANDIVKTTVYMGGTGTTLGLIIAMVISAKSKRYKTILKLAIVPNIFNINEPLIFGLPMMLNPIFLIPMVLSPVCLGVVSYLMSGLVNPASYNPAVQVVSTVPTVVTAFFKGGLPFVFILLVCLAVNTLLYLPFFKILDNKEYKLEQENGKE